MEIVKQTKFRDGAEVSARYSLYCSEHEFNCFCKIFGAVFGPPDFLKNGFDPTPLKLLLNEIDQIQCVRIWNTLFSQS